MGTTTRTSDTESLKIVRSIGKIMTTLPMTNHGRQGQRRRLHIARYRLSEAVCTTVNPNRRFHPSGCRVGSRHAKGRHLPTL